MANFSLKWAVVVALLVEQLLPTPEVYCLNPVICKLLYWTFVNWQVKWQDENKEKEAGNGPFKNWVHISSYYKRSMIQLFLCSWLGHKLRKTTLLPGKGPPKNGGKLSNRKQILKSFLSGISVSVQTLSRDVQLGRVRSPQGWRQEAWAVGQRPERDLHVGGKKQASQGELCGGVEEGDHQAEGDPEIDGSEVQWGSAAGEIWVRILPKCLTLPSLTLIIKTPLEEPCLVEVKWMSDWKRTFGASSVTRFGENSPLCQNLNSLWDIFDIVLVWYLQTFVPTLAIFKVLGKFSMI